MTPEAPTLADFLLQRISEDEAMFRRAGVHWSEIEQYMLPGFTEERVLAECTAKRRIIDELQSVMLDPFGDFETKLLRIMAQPYRDHPDFAPAWSVAEPLESP